MHSRVFCASLPLWGTFSLQECTKLHNPFNKELLPYCNRTGHWQLPNPVLFACSPSFSISILASFPFLFSLFRVLPPLALASPLLPFTPSIHPYQMQLVTLQPVCPASSFFLAFLYTKQVVSFPAHCSLREHREMLCYCVSLVCKVACESLCALQKGKPWVQNLFLFFFFRLLFFVCLFWSM